jgi:hypothetical protein
MPYTKRIVCLANSEKHGGSCVAGRELLNHGWGSWIRPISGKHPTGALDFLEQCYPDHTSPALLDIIEVDLLGHHPHLHQKENYVIGPSSLTKVGTLPFSRLAELVEIPWSLWSRLSTTGKIDCVTEQEAANLERSLYLLKVTELIVRILDSSGRRRYTGTFTLGRDRYELYITDPAICDRLRYLPIGEHDFSRPNGIHLCISLGEPYKGRCYKLIAAVIADPPL